MRARTSIATAEFPLPAADPVEEGKLADDGGGTVDPWGGATMIDPDGGRS